MIFNIKFENAEDEIDSVWEECYFLLLIKFQKNNQIYIFKDILQLKVIKASARRIESIEIKKLN